MTLVELNALHKSKCSCGSDMPSGCCKDVQINLKISDSHKGAVYSTAPSAFFFNLINHLFPIVVFKTVNENIFSISFYYPPPFKHKCELYKEINIFRI